jgi:8-amino-7-oxononanoate synthase
VLDFTSALYLGLEHGSRDLPGWEQLSLGKPAALEPVPGSAETERKLAALMGCERALLATSTLHLFWDLFAILGQRKINIFLDAGAYPILRWGVERAACSGTPVRSFRRHDPWALQAAMAGASERPPVIVADGYCPGCGRPAPIKEYLAQATNCGGLLVLDDTQALGIFGEPGPCAPYGRGGGGSMRRAGLSSGHGVVIGASLAKAFGAPLAALAGDAGIVDEFASQSATRVHCSPPSSAIVAAASRALKINCWWGDALRLKLARLVSRFRQGIRRLGLIGTAGLFPVQSLCLPDPISAVPLHAKLRERGIETVLHRGSNTGQPRISFVITARHSFAEIDCALHHLAEVMASGVKKWERS